MQGEDDRLGIVHRLDRDTSGLMLAAKDDDTQRALQNLIRTRTLDRRYITLVHGEIVMDEGTINTGIARSTRDRVKMAVSDDPFARQAITTFKVLEDVYKRQVYDGTFTGTLIPGQGLFAQALAAAGVRLVDASDLDDVLD